MVCIWKLEKLKIYISIHNLSNALGIERLHVCWKRKYDPWDLHEETDTRIKMDVSDAVNHKLYFTLFRDIGADELWFAFEVGKALDIYLSMSLSPFYMKRLTLESR